MNTARESVGILGVGSYLPDEVRTNDWWPRSVVEKWEQKTVLAKQRLEKSLSDRPGEALVLEAMRKIAGDPFRGAKERRVLSASMQPSEMEIAAARQAISSSGINPAEIDLVISYSFVPDELLCPNAFPIHYALGLSSTCVTLGVEAACNSFLAAFNIADAMISSGQARHALVVQSSAISRILPPDDPQSAWFGDGAAAVVMGAVREGYGVLGRASRTDSSLHRAVVTGVPDKRWYDEGRSLFYAKDRASAFRIMAGVADMGREVIEAAIQNAAVPKEAIRFFACHQISPWMRSLVQEFVGLSHATSVETFDWVGNLASVNVPLVLHIGSKEGLLKDGDVVAMYGGGAGITYSSVVLRWGK